MIAVASALALAALPGFVARLPKVNLPYTLEREKRPVELSGADEKAVFAAVPELAKSKEQPDTTFAVYGVAVVPWPGATWVLLASHYELPVGVDDTAWLLAFDANGAVLERKPIAEWMNSEVGESLEEVTLTPDATVERTRTTRPALQDLPPEVEMVVRSSSTSRVVKGHLEVGKVTFATNEGRFIDEKSKEQLSFTHSGKVFYQGTGDKPVQELSVEGDPKAAELTVRFASSKKPYVLTFDKTRESIRCAGPGVKPQTFTRVGWAR